MTPNDDLARLLYRVVRDFQAPMALLVAADPQRRVVGHQGFEHAAAMRWLLSADAREVRVIDAPERSVSAGLRSYAQAPVMFEGRDIGSLFVADRRRRWFDDEEVRHLSLMTNVAMRLLTQLDLDLDRVHAGPIAPVSSDAVDVRELETLSPAGLATSV